MNNKSGISSITLVIIVVVLMIFLFFNYYNYIHSNSIQKNYEPTIHQKEPIGNSYMIYFDTDGGQPISPITSNDLSTVSNIRAEKEDCIFECWLLDDKPISSYELTQDVTLKAKYISLKPTKEQLSNAKTIDYVKLFKGANTLVNNYYNITGEIVQDVGNNTYHVNMTKNDVYYTTYYTDRISVEIKGQTSEILMTRDIISFIGKYCGNISYTTVLLSDNKIPSLLVYGENLKVIGHTN